MVVVLLLSVDNSWLLSFVLGVLLERRLFSWKIPPPRNDLQLEHAPEKSTKARGYSRVEEYEASECHTSRLQAAVAIQTALSEVEEAQGWGRSSAAAPGAAAPSANA